MLDNGLENIELNIFRGAGVRDRTIFEEQLFRLINLVYEKSQVTTIINNQVWSVILTIILRLYQGIKDAVPVLLDTLTLPRKHISIFIMRSYSQCVLLGRENITRTSTEVTSEGLESMNQHCRLDGHVDRSSDMGAIRHLNYLLC